MNNYGQKLVEQSQTIIELLEIITQQNQEIQSLQENQTPLHERKLRTKQEVMDLLKMSESTYKRNIKVGLLIPMKINGFDLYFEEDLLKAMEESRRKGRF